MRQPTSGVMLLSESARFDLIRLRDRLRVLSDLAAAGSVGTDRDAVHYPVAMHWWFSRMARDLDDIVGAIRPLPEAANE